MKLTPLENVFPLMKECFPEVSTGSLLAYRDHCTAIIHGDTGFALTCPYNRGTVIQYIGVGKKYRRKGIASCIMDFVEDIYEGPYYAECIPDSPMYQLLMNRGWYRVPIAYVCPAWGAIPEDKSRVLMCNTYDPERILQFAKHYYDCGYGVSHDDLVEQYRKELYTGSQNA